MSVDIQDFDEVMAFIENPATKRASVIAVYAQALAEVDKTRHPYWALVNQAIVSRWSLTALKAVKREAWKAYEAVRS